MIYDYEWIINDIWLWMNNEGVMNNSSNIKDTTLKKRELRAN